jgi:hypothetical protein
MNFKVFDFKPILLDENGDEYFDLSAPVFDYNSDTAKALVFVNQEYDGRADLIALDQFGDEGYLDSIMKVNNLYNPFAVEEGQFLLIPSVTAGSPYYTKPAQVQLPANDPETTQFQQPDPNNVKDQNRVERLKQIAAKQSNGVTVPLPPNALQPGEETFKKQPNSTVIAGANMNTRTN